MTPSAPPPADPHTTTRPTQGPIRVVLVAAVADNGVIGNGPDIPWHLPGEQRLFKELTMGHALLIGRTTHESIGRALPGRTTIVLSRDPDYAAPGVEVAASFELALDRVPVGSTLYVAGGAQVYAAAITRADEQVLTRVPLRPQGDVHYPPYEPGEWERTTLESYDGFTREFLRRRPARA